MTGYLRRGMARCSRVFSSRRSDLLLFLLGLDFGLMALLQLRRRDSLLALLPLMIFLEQRRSAV